MRQTFFIIPAFLMLFIFGCNQPNEIETAVRFPGKTLSAGSDSDYTFTSLTSSRADNGDLMVTITGWGIEETGLFLNRQIDADVALLHVMGYCGTVSTHTYKKVTFSTTFTREQESALKEIQTGSSSHLVRLTKY